MNKFILWSFIAKPIKNMSNTNLFRGWVSLNARHMILGLVL